MQSHYNLVDLLEENEEKSVKKIYIYILNLQSFVISDMIFKKYYEICLVLIYVKIIVVIEA